MKKRWEKPKLIVLVRTTPQESVLLDCKGGSAGAPGTVNILCQQDVCFGTCDWVVVS